MPPEKDIVALVVRRDHLASFEVGDLGEEVLQHVADAVAEHHADILSHYGRDLGMRVARKHLGWYAEAAGLADLAAARAALMAASTPEAAMAAIRAVFSGAGEKAQAA